MTRVILLTFGFLGWAWYEMSGGSEFQPGETGVTLLARVEVQPLPAAPETDDAPEQIVVARADAGASLTDVSAAKIQPGLVSVTAPVQPVEPQKVAALIDDSIRSDATPEPAAPAPVAAVIEAVSIDYRVVTGSRVNLRAGPSTGFDVVTKLTRGEEVEVLADNGDGWVKLRALDGNDIGWMSAAFLVDAN